MEQRDRRRPGRRSKASPQTTSLLLGTGRFADGQSTTVELRRAYLGAVSGAKVLDLEARMRAQSFLASPSSASPVVAGGTAIATEDDSWPREPSPPVVPRVFLAGIFDAEGSCSRGILRISNKKAEILDADQRRSSNALALSRPRRPTHERWFREASGGVARLRERSC
jgi:hypothetical protein